MQIEKFDCERSYNKYSRRLTDALPTIEVLSRLVEIFIPFFSVLTFKNSFTIRDTSIIVYMSEIANAKINAHAFSVSDEAVALNGTIKGII